MHIHVDIGPSKNSVASDKDTQPLMTPHEIGQPFAPRNLSSELEASALLSKKKNMKRMNLCRRSCDSYSIAIKVSSHDLLFPFIKLK